MTVLTIGQGGEVHLPEGIRERYGLTADTSVRLVETSNGIFLIPQTGTPINGELLRELEEWQALGGEAWDLFPYEDSK